MEKKAKKADMTPINPAKSKCKEKLTTIHPEKTAISTKAMIMIIGIYRPEYLE